MGLEHIEMGDMSTTKTKSVSFLVWEKSDFRLVVHFVVAAMVQHRRPISLVVRRNLVQESRDEAKLFLRAPPKNEYSVRRLQNSKENRN